MSRKSTTISEPNSQTRILLDTCSYLRLAVPIHPLLGQPFGKKLYTLFIHKELQEELDSNNNLKTKFDWFDRTEYKENRANIIGTTDTEENKINQTLGFIRAYKRQKNIDVSSEDILCLAIAKILDIRLVSDDDNLIKLCKVYKVKIYTTIGLLHLMYTNKCFGLDKILEIRKYLRVHNDWLLSFNQLLKKYYNIDP